jgi:hypothetical protein
MAFIVFDATILIGFLYCLHDIAWWSLHTNCLIKKTIANIVFDATKKEFYDD